MCGIIGYVGADARGRADALRVARDTMTHRGPDDAGLFLQDQVCLGSRRLSILDLSPSGHMPMESADGRYTIVFNGAIYNFVELRATLEQSVRFTSTGDTEVILNGMRVWGWPALLNRLDGMFAFAIWDRAERRLFAARDRLGEKPFFHCRVGDGFAFASTIAALTALRPGMSQVDPHALDAYLTYQAVPAPFSIFRGIHALPPAHALQFDATTGALELSRYWDVSYARKRKLGEAEAIDELDQLLRESVRQRMRSDVPTGTLLSGGIDSSLITAYASEGQTTPLDAVTMGHESEGDEREYARMVAERYGVRLHEEVLRPAVVRDLPEIVWQYGQPLADVSIVPNYYIAAAARAVMTVALVGDGADEAFGGYARPVVERVAGPYRSVVPSPLRRLIGDAIGSRPGHPPDNPLLRRLALLARDGAGSARDAFVYDRAFRSMRDSLYSASLKAATREWHPDSLYRAVWNRADATDDVDRALYGDLTTYLPDQLLAKADISAMAHGLETRSPFLARDVVEYAAALPTSLRLHRLQTKYLLKRVAERHVPRAAIYRRKQGFVMPASTWLRTELAPQVHAMIGSAQFLDRGWMDADGVRRLIREHMSGERDWGAQLWTLLVLETWARLSLDGTLSRGDALPGDTR